MNWVWIGLSGILAAALMAMSMRLITVFGLANGDMIRAVGSLFTKSYESALGPGLVMHFFTGVVFAYFYAFIIGIAPIHNPAGVVMISGTLGFFHGMCVAAFLAIFVAEYHPLERFRRAGVGVLIAHIFGHTVYGVSLGFLFILMHIDTIAFRM